MIYGYLRGSTGEIDKENQRKTIETYAKSKGFKIVYIEDTISSGKAYEKRQISTLISDAKKGDMIIVAELSRFARDTEETLKIARLVLEKEINLEILNPSIKFDDSIATKAIITVMGLSSEMERYFIKSRTKISLQHRKELLKTQGYFINNKGDKVYQLGAVRGQSQKGKIDDKKEVIYNYLSKDISKSAICKFLEVSRGTLDRFLKKYPYDGQRPLL